MNYLEAMSTFYIFVAVVGFTLIVGYAAFCGLRQYVADARIGARYRTEDEEFRKHMKSASQSVPLIR